MVRHHQKQTIQHQGACMVNSASPQVDSAATSATLTPIAGPCACS